MLTLYELFQNGPNRHGATLNGVFFTAETPEEAVKLAKADSSLDVHPRRKVYTWDYSNSFTFQDAERKAELDTVLSMCAKGRVMLCLKGNPFKGGTASFEFPINQPQEAS